METKRCSYCGEMKPQTEFHANRARPDGLQAACKECLRVKRKPLSAENVTRKQERRREKRRADNPEWFDALEQRRALRERGFSLCAACGETKPIEDFWKRGNRAAGVSSYCSTCARARQRVADAKRDRTEQRKARYAIHKDRLLAETQAWRTALRTEIFAHYGNVCACCGEGAQEFLSIDHTDGGGSKHRKSLGVSGGCGFYAWLRKQGYPDGYQLLCHNCNMARGFYGYCPHQTQP